MHLALILNLAINRSKFSVIYDIFYTFIVFYCLLLSSTFILLQSYHFLHFELTRFQKWSAEDSRLGTQTRWVIDSDICTNAKYSAPASIFNLRSENMTLDRPKATLLKC